MTQSVLDHPLICERYFFPTLWPCTEPVIIESGGVQLKCHGRQVNPDAPTLVHFHGNGEVVADWVPETSEAILNLGINVFFAEYRGYGGSSGHPALVAMLDDVVAVFEHLGRPPKDLFVYGRSVGSIYAIEAAHRFPSLGGLIVESGISSPLERILMRVSPLEIHSDPLAMAEEANRHLDHKKKLSSFKGKALFLHCLGDTLVPVKNAEQLAAWCGGEARLEIFEEGDHNTVWALNRQRILELIRDFVVPTDT